MNWPTYCNILGKTTFARAIAGELKLPIICISSTELVTGISGVSLRTIINSVISDLEVPIF